MREIHLLSQLLAGAKVRNALGEHGNRLARPGIAADPRFTDTQKEGTKAPDLNALSMARSGSTQPPPSSSERSNRNILLMRWFVRRGLLDADEAHAMHEWHNDGGFSLDAAERIPAWDRAGLEQRLGNIAWPQSRTAIPMERITAADAWHQFFYLPPVAQ